MSYHLFLHVLLYCITSETGSLGLFAMAALVGPVQNICFITVHYFNSCIPIAQPAGQTAVLGRLSLSMCLCVFRTSDIYVYLGLSPVWLITVRRRYHFEERKWDPNLASPSLFEGRCPTIPAQ